MIDNHVVKDAGDFATLEQQIELLLPSLRLSLEHAIMYLFSCVFKSHDYLPDLH